MSKYCDSKEPFLINPSIKANTSSDFLKTTGNGMYLTIFGTLILIMPSADNWCWPDISTEVCTTSFYPLGWCFLEVNKLEALGWHRNPTSDFCWRLTSEVWSWHGWNLCPCQTDVSLLSGWSLPHPLPLPLSLVFYSAVGKEPNMTDMGYSAPFNIWKTRIALCLFSVFLWLQIMASEESGPIHKIFTYGTLKVGQPNNYLMNDASKGKSRFISHAVTVLKYPLVVATTYNIPFLLDVPGQGHVCIFSSFHSFLHDGSCDWQ